MVVGDVGLVAFLVDGHQHRPAPALGDGGNSSCLTEVVALRSTTLNGQAASRSACRRGVRSGKLSMAAATAAEASESQGPMQPNRAKSSSMLEAKEASACLKVPCSSVRSCMHLRALQLAGAILGAQGGNVSWRW